jgi:hypothetical protein
MAALHKGKRVISEELLKAVRRRSLARQRLTDARKALHAAEAEYAMAEAEAHATEQAERKEMPL